MRIYVHVIAAFLGAATVSLAHSGVSCRAALANMRLEQIFTDDDANVAFFNGLERIARFSLQRPPTPDEFQHILETLMQSAHADAAARTVAGLELWIDEHYGYQRHRLVEIATDQIEDWGIVPRALRAPRPNTASGIVRNAKVPTYRGRMKRVYPEGDGDHHTGDFDQQYDSNDGPR